MGNVRLSYADTNHDGIIQGRDLRVRTCTDLDNGEQACVETFTPGEVAEVNNYYPFGLLHDYSETTQNAYQYKYNGKELQETGMYDYGARMYMADIGRWGVSDPLSELQFAYSPYSYVYGNPIRFNDPTGMIGEDPDPKKIYNSGVIPEVTIKGISKAQRMDASLSFMGIQSLNSFHASEDRFAAGIRGSKAALATEKFERNLAFTMGTFMMGGSNLAASAGWSAFDWWLDYQSEEAKNKIGKVQIAAILLVIARKGNGLQTLADDMVAINKTTDGGGVLLNSTPTTAISSAMYYETAAEQSASIFKSIAHGHMFENGNKRTAVAIFEKLAKEAGIQTVSRQEMLDVATQVAKGKMTDVSEIAKSLTK
ncbi:hypothetical protein ATE47_12430 [Chryseobacterium sp. IHB B 17019]|nr:hypothetical protein ATE47_12430 [Chryseobacterium sp. IHB B 17019]